MSRTLSKFFIPALLTGCAYSGPQVENIVPKDQEKWLSGIVSEPKIAGIEHLVVYGDSLSDPGNLSRNTFQFVLPHEIYYKGRFSNGPVWADYVSNALNWTMDNYAVGGAATRAGKFPENLVVTPFPKQVDKSEDRLAELDKTKTLIAIWIGPNNYLRNGYEFQNPDQTPKVELLKKGVSKNIGEIKAQIERIMEKGFQRFAVGTMPELGGILRNPKGGATASDETLFLATKLHNESLLTMLEKLKSQHKDLKLAVYNAYDINRATYEDPKAYGFSNLKEPCFVGSLSGDFYGAKVFCDDPMGHKFWEYLHPNTKMQCFYAVQFLADIEGSKFIGGYTKAKGIARCLEISNKKDVVTKAN
jgi:phospholipase/lecithinase/hemolysin